MTTMSPRSSANVSLNYQMLSKDKKLSDVFRIVLIKTFLLSLSGRQETEVYMRNRDRDWRITSNIDYSVHLLIHVESLPEDARVCPPKRLRKSRKMYFRCSVPRTLVRVVFHWK